MKYRTIIAIILLFLAGAAVNTYAQRNDYVTKHTRMDRSRLNIGAYHLQPYARTETHIKDVADCGIDFIVCMENDRTALDLFNKYNVGAIVSGVLPGWWGGDGNDAGKMEEKNPISKYESAAKKFKDHPAIWGVDIGDEPSALDFPYYGKVMSKVEKLFPHQFAYLNLYPNYASVSENTGEQTVSQLGTRTYTEHIAEYCKNVAADYICYDFYLYHINVPRAYENLRVVSNACSGTGRSMWIVLQVNSHDKDKWISENELRFQAYTAMAFGAENIIWACYTAGWWNNQVVDTLGQKTQQYEKLKKVNAEIHKIGDSYMKYHRTTTTFVGFDGTDWLDGVKQSKVKALNDGVFTDLYANDNSPLVVGSMTSCNGNGGNAVFVCSADDPYDKAPKEHILRFKADGRKITVHGAGGTTTIEASSDGYFSVPITSNAGLLIEAEELL